MHISEKSFGITPDGMAVSLYRIENASGAYVTLTNYGCRIVSLCVPDQNNTLTDVVLGFDTLEDYMQDDASLGAVVGRYANRIAGASFSLNGQTYPLAVNNGPNHLHGGPTGFANRLWDASFDETSVTFSRISADGEEGYPGTLTLHVTYTFSDENELVIKYQAVSDADTILNLTNHAYFNLNGEGNGNVYGHTLQIFADQTTEVDDTLIPTGHLLSVADTPFDFRTPQTIGSRYTSDNPQFQITGTYDHNFVLGNHGQTGPCAFQTAAIATGDRSGISMTCSTDQPGIQIYVPAGEVAANGKHGVSYPKGSAVCLETQHYPDAIHHADFPSVVLKAGDEFCSTTKYTFSVIK